MNQNSSKFKHRIACFTVLTTILISADASAGWSIYGLGTLGGSSSYAYDINNSGQVVGASSLSGKSEINAFITGPNGIGMTALETLGGRHTFAYGINDSGQVMGSLVLNDNLTHSFITGPNGVGMTDIGALRGDYDKDSGEYVEMNYARDINESGQVVGYDGPWIGSIPVKTQAFMTGPNGIGMTGLDIGGFASEAFAINDSGQVVGNSRLFGSLGMPGQRAFITGPNGVGISIIEGLGGTGSGASGINNSGQVVGRSYTPGNAETHAFVTGPNGVGITDLGTLGGTFSSATDINESGQIIGTASAVDGSYHAFLYSDGEMLDLSLLPAILNAGWTNLNVTAINDLGQIVGSGNLHGAQQAFLLSPFLIPEFPIPVPEPQTYAMLLAGLGLLGLLVQRRKKRNLI